MDELQFPIELRIPPLSEFFDVWGVNILYSNNVIYILHF